MIKKFNKKAIIPIVLLLGTMTAIYLFSAQSGDDSNGVSHKVTRLFARLFFHEFDQMTVEQQLFVVTGLNYFVRKLAHFSVYAFLGICSYSLFYLTEIKHAYLTAVLLCAIYSVLDEVHQFFTPGRSIKIGDMVIDTVGAAFGAAIAVVAVVLIRSAGLHFAHNRKRKFGGHNIDGRK